MRWYLIFFTCDSICDLKFDSISRCMICRLDLFHKWINQWFFSQVSLIASYHINLYNESYVALLDFTPRRRRSDGYRQQQNPVMAGEGVNLINTHDPWSLCNHIMATEIPNCYQWSICKSAMPDLNHWSNWDDHLKWIVFIDQLISMIRLIEIILLHLYFAYYSFNVI